MDKVTRLMLVGGLDLLVKGDKDTVRATLERGLERGWFQLFARPNGDTVIINPMQVVMVVDQ